MLHMARYLLTYVIDMAYGYQTVTVLTSELNIL